MQYIKLDLFKGGVAEWLKAAVCKTVDLCLRWFESNPLHHMSGCSLMVEPLVSNQMTRVRFPSPAPDSKKKVFFLFDLNKNLIILFFL